MILGIVVCAMCMKCVMRAIYVMCGMLMRCVADVCATCVRMRVGGEEEGGRASRAEKLMRGEGRRIDVTQAKAMQC